MKNIHILLTDKPSRLTKPGGSSSIKLYTNGLTNTPKGHCKNYHLYITSDEKIKERGWHFNLALNLVEKTTSFHNGLLCEKIILTTDQDLIKNGVQAIDDKFLRWFVKNPSCERVEVEIKPMFPMYSTFIESIDNPPFYGNLKRKIIIPQEEPKQETLEEAAEKYAKQFDYAEDSSPQLDFIEGAKWQQERMYSEEEVIAIVEKSRETGLTAEYLLLTEQFKKK
jgi:hypothetical protein